jgi:tRNA(Ile)-lysidine synthase
LTPRWLAERLAGLLADVSPRAYVLAYSGGVDSQVLLDLLARSREFHDVPVRAMHIHHGLHADADAWTEACRHQCTERDIPLRVERVEVVGGQNGIEAAARNARYGALGRDLAAGEVLLTAHHRDDQVETLLLHLARGTATRGLAGMAERQSFGAGALIRPLLSVSRAAIQEYAVQQGLSWVDDPSNADTRHRRNLLRHRVLPMMRDTWPGLDQVLARTAEQLAEDRTLLDQVAHQDYVQCRAEAGLSWSACKTLEDARLRNLLRYWLRREDLPLPDQRQMAELCARMREQTVTGRFEVAWPGVVVGRYRDLVRAGVPQETVPAFELSWNLAAPLRIRALGISLHAVPATGAGLSRAKMGAAVQVRSRRGGEHCQISPLRPRRTLKKLLQEAGVPPRERARLPLVFADDQLAAIGDRWVCSPFGAAPDEEGIVLQVRPL